MCVFDLAMLGCTIWSLSCFTSIGFIVFYNIMHREAPCNFQVQLQGKIEKWVWGAKGIDWQKSHKSLGRVRNLHL